MKHDFTSTLLHVDLHKLHEGGKISFLYECDESIGRVDHFLSPKIIRELSQSLKDFTKAETRFELP